MPTVVIQNTTELLITDSHGATSTIDIGDMIKGVITSELSLQLQDAFGTPEGWIKPI